MGNKGFIGPSSLLYHLRLPTAVKSIEPLRKVSWAAEPERVVRHRHFRTAGLETGPSPVLDRVPLLFNGDVALSMVTPEKEDSFLYRNGQGDELVFVVEGEGSLESSFGALPFRAGDYVVIPRGVLHRWRLTEGAISIPGDRERGLRAHAKAVPQRARPAHRDGAVLRTGHPAPRAAGSTRRDRRVPDRRQERQPGW